MPSTTPSDQPRPRRVVAVARAGDPAGAALVEEFGEAGVDATLRETTRPDDVADVVAEAIASGVDAIAAVGGDGALNLVLAAVAAADSTVPVVPVNAGTVNLMCQVLDLPTSAASVQAVVAQAVTTIDLGETSQGWFVMNASTGYDAATIGAAADHSGSALGRVRFLIEGVRRLRRDSPRSVAVSVDGDDVFVGRAMSVVVLNVGQRVSDGFDVAPDASFVDGRLDLAVVRVATFGRMVATVARLALRRPVPNDDIVRAQGARIEIDWRRAVASQRDGDAGDDVASLVVEARPSAVRMHHGRGFSRSS